MDAEAKPKRLLMVLTQDGAPIAVKMAAISKGVLELMIAGFDARLEKYSPGMRLDEYWVKWAFEQRLDIDFGNGGEHYKRFWSRTTRSGRPPSACPALGGDWLACGRANRSKL